MTGNFNWVHSELVWGIVAALAVAYTVSFVGFYVALSRVFNEDVGEAL